MPADEPPLTVVGMGAEGWAGLSPEATRALNEADVVIGSKRQLALLEGHLRQSEPWPTPMSDAIGTVLSRHPGRRIAVLASGDPMFYGVGTSLVKAYGPERVQVIPHISSVSLACARLGWEVEGTEVISAVGRPLATLRRALQPGRRILVLVSEADGAARTADLLSDSGFGASRMAVLTQIGGPDEGRADTTAGEWATRGKDRNTHDPLAIVAVEAILDDDAVALGLTAGLPDEAFLSDGALTKQEVRAVTLAKLAPRPGELLWDVGAGSGSIAIEWMRTHPSNTAIAIEPRPDRRERIAANAARLGVPGIVIVATEAPEAFDGLMTPDAIFVGGGLTDPGVLDACLEALPTGGRLVANGVTIETESLLADCCARLGGRLTRIAISHADRMGTFTTFRPSLPVTQWVWSR